MKLANRETCDKMYQIIGKSYDVINYYHRGLQESAYHAALAWEMRHVDAERYFFDQKSNKILLIDKDGNQVYPNQN